MSSGGAYPGDDTSHAGDGGITGINITPLVDIALVLLIVFLVTAKLTVVRGMPMDVPQTSNHAQVQVVLSITIDAAGRLALDGAPLANAAELERAAAARAARGDVPAAELRAVIAASSAASHGAVVSAMDALRSAGISKIAFAVERKL